MKLFWLLLLLPFYLNAQEFEAQLDVSSEEVRLDENLTVTLKLNFPKGYKVSPDALTLNLLERGNFSEPPFKLVSYQITDSSDISETFSFVLEPQLVGYHPITFFDIVLSSGKGKELISPVRFVHVLSTPVEPATFIPLAPLLSFDKHYPYHPALGTTRELLYPPEETLFREAQALQRYKTVPWIETLVIFLTIGLLYLFRNYHQAYTPAQRALKARQLALSQIQAMRKKRLPSTANYDSYYAELTDIIRSYLNLRYGVNAPVQTTHEFLTSLKEQKLFDPIIYKEIKELFLRAEEVKFGGSSPSNDECAEAELTAKKLVLEEVHS